MASESGGGGSNESTRSLPKNTPIGYQGLGGNAKQQIEDIHGAFDRQERERRDKIDEQVWHADQVSFALSQGADAFASAGAQASGSTKKHHNLTDEIADAIIGALLIVHYAAKLGKGVGSVVRGNGIPKDVTPKPGTKVFTGTQGVAAFGGVGAYSGSADRMERQTQKVMDQAEVIPGEWN